MKEEKIQLFSEVLDALLHNEQVPVHLLFRLSDMPMSAESRFFAAWPGAVDDRREEIMGHLVDLAEDNFAVDFTPIFKAGLSDPLAAVRVLALDGLWDATDVRLVAPILRLMQTDDNQDVRAAAARALAHFVLLAEWGQIPTRPLEPVIPALLAAYEDEATAVPIRRAALEALGAASHARVNALIEEAYEHDDPAMNLSAIFAMGNSADPRWLPTILEELGNPSADVRAEAATAAGSMGRSEAIPLLAELTHDEDDEVCAAAIAALGQIGGDQVKTLLTDLLEDPDFEDMHELVQESLESLLLLGGELDLMDYADDGDDGYDDDDLISEF
ncbi:MAG: HEAT repeat domain-containing protein [Chloroflexi bacterium]|nr:HEAT repeat domain-containing protein [Chloroflexota bacterium]